METIVIPNDDDEDDYPLPTFSRPAFGSSASSSSLPEIAGSPERSLHRPHPSSDLPRPSLSTPARPQLKGSASYSVGIPTPPSHDEPRLGKLSNGSNTSLLTGTSIGSSAGFMAPRKGSKASLTSIRNAFKSSAPVPPVPNLNSTAYPALKNPFSRYNEPASPSRPFGSPKGPHIPRKSTASSRSIGGRSAASQSSHDIPALPPIPTRSTPSRMGRQGSDAGSMFAFRRHGSVNGLDGIEESTRTAGEEALRAVWREFREAADGKITRICGRPLNTHPSLPAYLESGVDPTFDLLITSLANCAKRYARKVADLLNGWCKTHCEGIGASEVRAHLDRSLGLQMRVEDAAAILGERKTSAARFISNRALIELVKLTPRESMGEELGMILEQNAFHAYRSERLDEGQVPHRRAVSQLQVELIGCLSTSRFLTVGDRFIRELSKHTSAVSKESEMRIEHLLRGMKHLKLRVYPETELEMSAEFITQLAAFFNAVHGQSLKCAYAETLTSLLHPVIETATAEVNHPMWAKAILTILGRAIIMSQKPRYWATAFPLVIVALGVSPRDVFMQHWQMCIDNIAPRLKDRAVRVVALNCFSRLLWIYLNRCSESATSTRKRLETVMKFTFTPTGLYPSDLPIEPFVQILHFAMTRLLDFGEDLVGDYLREDGSAERATALVKAIGYTLKAIEEDRPATWPQSADFSTFSSEGFVSSGEVLPEAIAGRQDVTNFLKKVNPAVSTRLYACDRAISHLLLSNVAVHVTAHASSVEGLETIMRKHGDVHVSYPSRFDPILRLQAAILDIVPRTFHEEGSFPQVANILSRGTFSADPSVCTAASGAMRRYAQTPLYCAVLVNTYLQFVFDTRHVFRDTFVGSRLFDSQFERVVTLWADLLEALVGHYRAEETVEGVTPNLIDKIDGVALFLLCSSSVTLRRLAYRILAAARDLEGQRRPSAAFRYSRIVPEKALTRVIQIYSMSLDESRIAQMRALSWFTSNDRGRLDMASKDSNELLRRIAESDHPKDGALWLAILPHFIANILEQLPEPAKNLRSIVTATVLRLQGHVASIASVSAGRVTGKAQSIRTSADVGVLADHWRAYLSVLTVTMPSANLPATPVQRTKEAVILTPDTISSPALFHYLASVLSWDDPRFKDAAVYALGAIGRDLLGPLSEVLFNVVRRLADAKVNPRERKTAHGPLWTSLAHVFRLISPLILDSNAHVAISSIIGFVKLTYTLLSDRAVKEDFELQSLRRSFCVVVENLTNTLSKLDSSERFFGEIRGAIFELCYEWCHVGRRPDVIKARESQTLQAAAEGYRGERDRAQYLDDLQAKTKLLSSAAAEAMAGLCQGKLISTSETTPAAQSSDHIVEPLTVLRWIRGMFSAGSSHHDTARKALFAVLKYNWDCSRLVDEVLHQSFGESEQFALEASFFGVVADVISQGLVELPIEQVTCLVLSKLGHPVLDVRLCAFQLAISLEAEPDVTLLPAVGSSAPNIYRHAQKEMSTRLAEVYADSAIPFLAECTTRLSQLEAPRRRATLAILPPWVNMLELSPESEDALSHLVYLAIRFGDDHLDDIREVFVSLNAGAALVKFLFDQGGRRKSPEFVTHAQRIMACLAQDDTLFEEICAFVEPSAMASISEDPVKQSILDGVISATRTQTFSTGQLALIFAGELLAFRQDVEYLPTLLHAAIIHADNAGPALRDQCQGVLFQVLRAWVASSGGSERQLASLGKTFWRAEDDGANAAYLAPPKMTSMMMRILAILTPIQPRIKQIWGELALTWATSCPIRHLACRSFQLFRILSPKVSSRIIADILARLSSTIASPSPEIQAFNLEVLRTFAAITRDIPDLSVHPQIFWCTVAALSTPYEEEFAEVIELLSHVLDKTNLSDPSVIEHLLSFRPVEWVGPEPHLQTLLLPGLRSSKTDMLTFDLVRRLASCAPADLIDPSEERLLHGFIAALPWMLHSTDLGEPNEDLAAMALDLASLAEDSNPSLGRLLTSFAHSRFRSKDDFIRQAASLLRDHLKTHALDMLTLLLGFILNTNDWMRDKSMQVLKLLLMAPEARAQVQTHGNELLQPLLRLVSTRHSAQALDVLDLPVTSDAPVTGEIFGPIASSGWSVPAKEASALTKENVTAVFNTCAQETRAASQHFSVVQFADMRSFNPSQLSLDMPSPPVDNASMGDLVGALHSLNQFFDDGIETPMNEKPMFNYPRHKHTNSTMTSSSVSSVDLPNHRFYGLSHRHQFSYSSTNTEEYVEGRSGLFNLEDASSVGLSEGNQTPVKR